MRFIFLALVTGWPAVAAAVAGNRVARCSHLLMDRTAAFEPDLRLDADRLEVTFRGTTFRVQRNRYYLLQMLIDAPHEAVTMDDLITGLWGDHEPEYPEVVVRSMAAKLRTKFKLIDPAFDKLQSKSRAGLYWKRDRPEVTSRGRIAVAKYIYEGYADGHVVELQPKQHAVLTALLTKNLVTVRQVHAPSQDALNVITSTLNQRFRAVLGTKVAVPGPRGLGAFQLNKRLKVENFSDALGPG